jgi:ABC-type branched-subunit amino acid transport system substrate-binding protein
VRYLGIAFAVVLLAACGSRIDPAEVAASNGGAVPGAAQPGTGPGQAPGAGAGVGTAPATGSTGRQPDPGVPPPAGEGPGQAPPAGGTHRASCTGFRNQPGITDDAITIANAADVSGPVPGLFRAAQDAVRAYAAYFNASADICGRKLEVLPLDTRTDAGADQQAYETACSEAFAAVGSMGAFDSGGAATAQHCGLPDLRSGIVTHARLDCTTCFATQSANPGQFPNAIPDYFLHRYADAARHAAYLWINAGPAGENASTQIAALRKRGVDVVYTASIDVSEFNYAPYVQEMRDHGVRWVEFLGADAQAVRLAQAMRQQGLAPDVFLLDATGYDESFVEGGGPDVDGASVFVNFTPFEERSSNPELALYLQWLQQVRPGAQPTYTGLFAWSAARLFTEQAIALGGRLTRATLVDRLAHVDGWTDHGLHAPQHVGSKDVGGCWRFLRLEDGTWRPEGGTSYRCAGVTRVG